MVRPVTRPRLLDLFCCAGGASVGYDRAGFDVTGRDHVTQPDYPFPFQLGDALRADLSGYQAVHASPPCKAHTPLRHTARAGLFDYPHPDLIGPTRDLLVASGLPYVIENVPGAAPVMRDPVCMCGSSFGLPVRRHRLFESNVPLVGRPCRHDEQRAGAGRLRCGGLGLTPGRPRWWRWRQGVRAGRRRRNGYRLDDRPVTPQSSHPARLHRAHRRPADGGAAVSVRGGWDPAGVRYGQGECVHGAPGGGPRTCALCRVAGAGPDPRRLAAGDHD